ncbi:putative bifunctional diguanylate cyclase/phosphodiesterase [Chitinimonas koreensis]|uniref:putative bifunctional diguanylate cyclase/phosphodiesterase n=1 Tax=Chitinimonas koreensis TaxID=356302 RepID=UPI00040B7DC8|nr:EAL domain-containing protein [Chitinimonas koreensis]
MQETAPSSAQWSYTAALLNRFGDALLAFDKQLVCRIANASALELLGTSADHVTGLHARQVYPPEHVDRVVAQLEAALGGEVSRTRAWRDLPSVGRRCLDARVEPCLDADGRIVGALHSARDVTEVAEAEERARLAMMMFEHTTEGLMVLGADRRVRLVNPAFSALTGYPPGEVLGERPDLLVAGGTQNHNPYLDIWHALEYDGTWQGEVIYRGRDGKLLPTWQTVVRVRDGEGDLEHYLAIFTDLSERQRFEQQLERLAYYDVLTSLPNRALLSDRIAQAISRAERTGGGLALLFVDLDRFKVINDTLGNSQGDRLLRAVSQRLGEAADDGATVSRYGADQFLLLLPELGSPDQAATQAGRLLLALAAPHEAGGQTLTVTASIGIAVFPDDGEDRETLVQHAETAMQAAKRAGRNTFRFFTQDMNQRSAEFLLLENHLRQGLARDEFRLYYQPQIDLKTRKVIGMEALMRWRHPEMGLVPPNRFIPAAEESGLIVPLGRWAMKEACRQNKAWQAAGLLTAPVAVNVSARQFAEQLDEVAAEALAEAGLASEWLELEVTESTLMDDVNEAILTLGKLKRMGVRLAIDDFGTGYSSLSYLKRFPLDKLKVDRSFVIDILDDPDDAAIAGAIVSLAKNLRLTVIAEGVETAQQLDFLEQLGCDEMQGFLVAAPLPAEKVADFLADWHSGKV